MCNDEAREDSLEPTLTDLGAATELTQGTFMPQSFESVLIKDYFDDAAG